MKHSLKLILTEVIIIFTSLFCLLVLKINYNLYLLLLSLSSVGIYFLFKPDKRKERFSNEILVIIIISVLLYYSITFLVGLFWGVYYTPYSKTLLGIIRNIITGLFLILSIENIRNVLVRNYAYHKAIILLTPFVCTCLELPSLISFYTGKSTFDLLNILLNAVLPCFTKNLLLTYINYKANKKLNIIYQILMIIPLYIVPILPNLGEFFYIVINIMLPIVIGLVIYKFVNITDFSIDNSRSLKYSNLGSKAITACLVFFIVMVLYLTSNMFRFTALAIGSNSMKGTINKGDIIIIDKKAKNINIKDVIAFKEQGVIIVHRVVDINKRVEGQKYQTKGDANETADAWKLSDQDIVGKVVLRIRWLGLPTVALSELIKDK